MCNIILIGFMGCGKSTLAKLLSQRLGFSWMDMDELVYQKTNTQNMHEVFAKGGELLLRETELAIVKEYASKSGYVISTGGGVVLNKIILDYFREGGSRVIFLHVPFEQIAERLKGDCSRPLFSNGASAKKMYDFRLPLYIQYADEIIEVDKETVEEVAEKIQVNVDVAFS
jgi:shikimate kinase